MPVDGSIGLAKQLPPPTSPFIHTGAVPPTPGRRRRNSAGSPHPAGTTCLGRPTPVFILSALLGAEVALSITPAPPRPAVFTHCVCVVANGTMEVCLACFTFKKNDSEKRDMPKAKQLASNR